MSQRLFKMYRPLQYTIRRLNSNTVMNLEYIYVDIIYKKIAVVIKS
jgi:hypothetical protein